MNEEELTIAKAIFEENGNFDIEVELGGSTFAQVRGSVETDVTRRMIAVAEVT